MLTRWRVIRALAVFLLSIILIIYTASRLFILSSFESLERQVIATQVARVTDALEDRLAALSSKAGDWGTWTEPYDYIVGNNPDFPSAEITDATMAQLRINLIMLVNTSGKIVYYKGFDLEKQKQASIENVDQIRLDKFLAKLTTESQLSGLVLLPAAPMLIAARPIITTEGKGPPHGAMVFGRYLDGAELNQLSKTTHLNVGLYRLDQELPTNELKTARTTLSESDPQFVQSLDEQKIAGYALLHGIDGKPALIFRLEEPRDIFQQGWTSTRYFLLALSTIVLIFGLLALTLADRLMRSRRKERESEQLYYALAEAAPDAIYVVDRNARIKYANETASRQFEDNWPIVLGEPRGPETLDPQAHEIGRVLETQHPLQIERGVTLCDKKAWLDIKMVPLANERGERNSVLGIARDVTERKHAEERVARQMRRLRALHAIDEAITGSLDLTATLNLLLTHTTAELDVDGAQVLLSDELSQTLKCAARIGLDSGNSPRETCTWRDSLAGRAAMQQTLVRVQNLNQGQESLEGCVGLIADGFVSAVAAPLISRGRVRGVLEIFHRAQLDPDQEWLDFVITLAGQAAIAVDSLETFSHLQRSHVELALAYDSTLEGWTHALDLREGETAEHSRRVADLTVELARSSGVGEDELVHVRRGALLHDIGKIAISDSVLLKRGVLTHLEREIIQKHPAYAYELLSPIHYLRRALDIPYCHHEKWDGTGYPRGLKGEEIPLAARIFAVVDVWDALGSNRPYRSAWSGEKVVQYLRDQSGEQFDPRIVETFLQMIGKGQVPSPTSSSVPQYFAANA